MGVLLLNSLPLGFRFRPTDEELIHFYLRSKINGNRNDEIEIIREIDVCKCEPWDLPDLSAIKTQDPEWFFFCPLDRKYPTGNRLNRATEAGYWKATGKDRKIKSGSTLIGMKKTLVFYNGRAPRGKRTNWVMHEYRTTLDELDGTKPGQNAFVICRLFKKQDETIEDINSDEVDPSVLSPTEDMVSELEVPQASPTVKQEAEKACDTSETCFASFRDEVISNAVAPIFEGNSDNHDNYNEIDQVAEISPAEVDLLEEALNHFYDPMMEPLFSPLHNQIEAEQAPWMFDHVGNCYNVEFGHGTNENDPYISNFLESILKNSDDYHGDDTGSQKNSESETHTTMTIGKDGGFCSKPDSEVAQVLLGTDTVNGVPPIGTAEDCGIPNSDGELFSNHMNTSCDVDGAITGIRTRSRPSRSQLDSENPLAQGNASRRLRLQCKLQVHSLHCDNAIYNRSDVEIEDDSKSVVTKEEKVVEKDITVGCNADFGIVLGSKTIVSVRKETSSRWSKVFSVHHSRKPFAVVFRVFGEFSDSQTSIP
ncbi:hypothetical protein ERO13_D09G181800v2 [Gossypium hirsutum]|uniref:NAC domain-containing protein n=1 Tax=Gossypium tomentosum TaxID=34277 RepID=A0A5D2JL96_GOSTO|nr:hypothetical protein ERO13_D09G181800v2 [Gossypium hirsutum]TYH55127.1 hypothetical protein ES332_D09G216500v1 [Gossypium tomentosum]TYH55129.1 hypothetical protein ES332_D09G216500v1 [Gossypium tomentosum]